MSDSTPRTLPVVQPRDLTPDPVFARVGIVGLGLMGGSLALALRERYPRALVVGVDRKDVLEEAMRRHAIDVAADDLGMLAEVDLVVLAAPVRENIRLLAGLPDAVPGEAVITDLSSTKQAIVEAARALPARLAFVGGHPMAGAARGGFEHARPDLYQDRPWLLTPSEGTPVDALHRVQAFAAGVGGVVSTVAPAAHDQLLAYLSHLPQLAVSALMALVGGVVRDPGLALAGRGLVDTTRLASSPADIWQDIAATNAVELGRALDALIATLTALRNDLGAGEALADTFEEAARWRAVLMHDRKS